jgi:hypothetical protein
MATCNGILASRGGGSCVARSQKMSFLSFNAYSTVDQVSLLYCGLIVVDLNMLSDICGPTSELSRQCVRKCMCTGLLPETIALPGVHYPPS